MPMEANFVPLVFQITLKASWEFREGALVLFQRRLKMSQADFIRIT